MSKEPIDKKQVIENLKEGLENYRLVVFSEQFIEEPFLRNVISEKGLSGIIGIRRHYTVDKEPILLVYFREEVCEKKCESKCGGRENYCFGECFYECIEEYKKIILEKLSEE